MPSMRSEHRSTFRYDIEHDRLIATLAQQPRGFEEHGPAPVVEGWWSVIHKQ